MPFYGGGGSGGTLTNFPGGLWTPLLPNAANSAPTFSGGQQLNASGEMLAYVFTVPRTGTLDKAEFKLGAVAVAPLNGIKVSFQDVSTTTGDPDETVDEYAVVTAGLTANAWVVPGNMTVGNLGVTKRSVTIGQKLALVVEFESFTAGNDLNVLNAIAGNSVANGATQLYYMDAKLTGSWVKSQNTCSMALKYDDGTYAFVGGGCYPYSTILTEPYNQTTALTDERGLIFQFPVSVQVGGAWVRGIFLGNADIVLYDSDGATPLATVSVDKDQTTQASAGSNAFVWFPAPVTLAAATNYYLTLKPTSATNVTLYALTVNTAAIMDGFEGGQAWAWTEKVDSGSFAATTTTKRPFMGLLVTAIKS